MNKIEWAVIERSGFRGGVTVHKGDLGSRDEAEAWLAALTITVARSDDEHFMATDGIVSRKPLEIGWRVVDTWHRPDEHDERE